MITWGLGNSPAAAPLGASPTLAIRLPGGFKSPSLKKGSANLRPSATHMQHPNPGLKNKTTLSGTPKIETNFKLLQYTATTVKMHAQPPFPKLLFQTRHLAGHGRDLQLSLQPSLPQEPCLRQQPSRSEELCLPQSHHAHSGNEIGID